MPEITVIIPAYNVEKYLPDAIRSVREQTFTDWELILVDDGSTDSTAAICDLAASQDKRITVIHRGNGGLSEARNTGIGQARGRYITFLDGDDLIADRFLEISHTVAVRERTDIVCCGHTEFQDGKRCPFKGADLPRILAKCETMPSRLALSLTLYQRRGMQPSACGKLYRSEIFRTNRYRPGITYEDLDAIYRVLLTADRVTAIRTPLYGYRQQPSSILHTFSLRRTDVLDVTDRMLEWISQNAPALMPAARDRRMSAHFNILILLLTHRKQLRQMAGSPDNPDLKDEITAIKARCRAVIKGQRLKSLRNPMVRPKNRIGALLSYLFF